MAAVKPCAALYCDRLQFSESADNRKVAAARTSAETAAAARPANTIDNFTFIIDSNEQRSSRTAPTLEQETQSQARDSRRDDATDKAERRTGHETGSGRGRGVQYVEDVNVDVEPPSGAKLEILAGLEVQDVLRRKPLCSIWLDAQRGVAVLRDGSAAIRVGLPENIRSLPRHTVLGLKESGDRHIAGHPIAARHVAG